MSEGQSTSSSGPDPGSGCKGTVLQGPNKGKPCCFPPKENGFCGRHVKQYEYQCKKTSGVKICRNFMHGCKNIIEENAENQNTCEFCLNRYKEDISKCKKEGCNFKKSEENDYCGKHQRDFEAEEAAKNNMKLCSAGCCTNIPEQGKKVCNECRAKQFKYEKERRKARVEKNIENQNNDKHYCRNCGDEYEPFETRNKKPSTKCKKCYDKQAEIEKNRSRNRDYAMQKYSNIDAAYNTHINDCKKRNIKNELSLNDYKKLVFDTACTYCGHTEIGKIIGIDRMDNNKGYTVENCTSCCAECNRIKHILHPEFFINKAIIITNYAGPSSVKDSEPANKLFTEWKEYFRKDQRKRSYTNYQKHVIKREIEFALSEEQFHDLYEKPCNYCGVSIIKTGIDRVDSSKGYTEDNCVSCCATCNIAKADFMLERYLERLSKIKIPDDLELWAKMKNIKKVKYGFGGALK